MRQLRLLVLMGVLLTGPFALHAIAGVSDDWQADTSTPSLRSLLLASSEDAKDRVFLLNGDVLVCKVLRVTSNTIEVDPEGARPFDVIDRDKVKLIVYADNSVVQMSGTGRDDERTQGEASARPVTTSEPRTVRDLPRYNGERIDEAGGSYGLTKAVSYVGTIALIVLLTALLTGGF